MRSLIRFGSLAIGMALLRAAMGALLRVLGAQASASSDWAAIPALLVLLLQLVVTLATGYMGARGGGKVFGWAALALWFLSVVSYFAAGILSHRRHALLAQVFVTPGAPPRTLLPPLWLSSGFVSAVGIASVAGAGLSIIVATLGIAEGAGWFGVSVLLLEVLTLLYRYWFVPVF